MASKTSDRMESVKVRLNRIITCTQLRQELPHTLERLIETEEYKQLLNANGEPFKTLGEFLCTWFPTGVGVGQDRATLRYEELMSLCCDWPKLLEILRTNKPDRRRRDMRPAAKSVTARGCGNVDNVNDPKRVKGGNGKGYLAGLLQEKSPDFYEAYIRGEYRSIHAACVAAGLKKPGHDSLMRLKSYWKKADSSQRKAFKAWLRTKEAR